MNDQITAQLRQCKGILFELLSEENNVYAWPFVNTDRFGSKDNTDLHGTSLDLRAVVDNVNQRKYTNVSECVADIKSIFSSFIVRHANNHKFVGMAKQMEKILEKILQNIEHVSVDDQSFEVNSNEMTFNECDEIMHELMQSKNSRHFYCIKNSSVDLIQIKLKLSSRDYKTVDEFAADVRLMFSYCYRFNENNPPLIEMAQKMQNSFERRFAHVIIQPVPKDPINISSANFQMLEPLIELSSEFERSMSSLKCLVDKLNSIIWNQMNPSDSTTQMDVEDRDSKLNTTTGEEYCQCGRPDSPKRYSSKELKFQYEIVKGGAESDELNTNNDAYTTTSKILPIKLRKLKTPLVSNVSELAEKRGRPKRTAAILADAKRRQ